MKSCQNKDICTTHELHPDKLTHARAVMPPEEELASLAELFALFGDTTRIRILSVLEEDELCVCDLSEALGMTASAVSHQLKLLRAARLIKARREGKAVFYSLADDHVKTIVEMGKEHVEELFR